MSSEVYVWQLDYCWGWATERARFGGGCCFFMYSRRDEQVSERAGHGEEVGTLGRGEGLLLL